MAKKPLDNIRLLIILGIYCFTFIICQKISFCKIYAQEAASNKTSLSTPATPETSETPPIPPPDEALPYTPYGPYSPEALPANPIEETPQKITETEVSKETSLSYESEGETKQTESVEENVATDESKETISLDLRGIEITEFLKVLSRKLKINIIPSKKVSGRINLFLNNISYKDALDVLVLSQGLAYEKKGKDIIMVMTESEYESLYGQKFNDKKEMKMIKLKYAQPKLVFNALSNIKSSIGNVIVDEVTGTILIIDTPEKIEEMTKVIKDLDQPVVTEIFELQYAKVADVKENLSSLIAQGAGSILTDERSNTIIVTDLPGNMQKIRQTIVMLDQETKQVLIEAEILELDLRDRLQSGVDWQQILSNNFYDFALSGTFQSALGAALVGTFTSDYPDMEFLNTIGKTRVLSRPRIAVTNNEEATILVGTREAYVTGTTSQSGESTITSDTVEFVDVGVKLKVVPTINRDGYITMKIKPEISTVSRTLTTGDPDAPRSQIPIVSTSEAETTVKVKDGATIMIAGLRKNEDKQDIDGLPIVSKIPIVNLLFSRRDRDEHQTEIIILITPHIITGEQSRSWDLNQLKKYPDYVQPQNRGYFEPKIKRSHLKEKTFLKR